MPKSRKRKGARKYVPKLRGKMDPVEKLIMLKDKVNLASYGLLKAMGTEGEAEAVKVLEKAAKEGSDFSHMPLRAVVGPADGNDIHH